MRETYRILDANINRAREALRVAEDCGRFALNDPAITAMAKNLRNDLREILTALPIGELITCRDSPGDVGTVITSTGETNRKSLSDVAVAACKRLPEALRTIEECCKFVAPDQAGKIERMRYNSYTLEQRLVGRLFVGNKIVDASIMLLISARSSNKGLRATAREAIKGGADIIQLREKKLPDAMFLAEAAELRELTDETGRLLIINDRPDIAAIVGADGVHLGQHDLPIADARRLLRPGAVVGRSTHNLAQALAAENEGADYIGLGPINVSKTKKDAGPVVTDDIARQVAEKISIPIFAIGGISLQHMEPLTAAGINRVAVCSEICDSDNPAATTTEFKDLLKKP